MIERLYAGIERLYAGQGSIALPPCLRLLSIFGASLVKVRLLDSSSCGPCYPIESRDNSFLPTVYVCPYDPGAGYLNCASSSK